MHIGDGIAVQTPGRQAIVAPDGQTLTYGLLNRLIAAEAAGVGGGRLAPVAEADPVGYLVRFLAILRAGRIAACLPEQFPPEAAAHMLQRLGQADLPPGDLFYLGLTSGTTGEPKAVLRTHRSWLDSFELMTRLFGAPERVAVPGSLAYSAALITALQTLEAGGTLWLLPSAPGAATLDLLEREQISVAFLVPARQRALLSLSGGRSSDLPISIVTAGAKLDPETRAGMAALFPHGKLFEYYGSAEMGFVTWMGPAEGALRPHSVGQLCPGVDCQLRSPDGEPVPVGQPGIIHVRSPYQFAGYAGWGGGAPGSGGSGHGGGSGIDPDGWVSVGDWGSFDAEGFLHLLGRGPDLINVGGAKVFAAEVEAVLTAHPAVVEAAVVGVDDRLRGQSVAAVVVPRPDLAVTAADLRHWCAQRLPRVAVPRQFAFAASLPRNPGGKVDRSALMRLLRKVELP